MIVYFFLSYVIGQIYYFHSLTAIFIFLLVFYSLIIHKVDLNILIGVIACMILGYMIESTMQQPLTIHQEKFINRDKQQVSLNIKFKQLPIIHDNRYTASIITNNKPLTLSSYNAPQLFKPNAKFIRDYVCRIEGEYKPPSDIGMTPYFTIKHFKQDQCWKENPTFKDKVYYFRNYITEEILKSHLAGKANIIALITGQSQYIETEKMTLLRQLGISHLFAISGTHIAILVLLVLTIGKRLPVPVALSKWALLFILPLFLIFTGQSPSAERAVIMAILVVISSFWKEMTALNILLVAYILISSFSPSLHLHVGFQFSFVICFLLIFLQKCYSTASVFKSIWITSLMSTFGTLPINYQHFNEFQWLGLITNILFIPLYCFGIIPLSYLAGVITLINVNWLSLLEPPYQFLFKMEEIFLLLFSSLTQFRIYLPDYGEIGYLIIIIFVFTLILLCKLKRYIVSVIWLFTGVLIFSFLAGPRDNRMTVLDVGQGDSILFENKKGEVLMIDTGGQVNYGLPTRSNFNITERKSLPLLKKRGIRRIDMLILTHDHDDHIGEFEHLSNVVQIKSIVLNPNHFNKTSLKNIITIANQKNISLKLFPQYNEFDFGVFHFKLLNSDIVQSEDPNEHSIVTLVSINGTNILLMGDATTKNEEKLMTTYHLPQIDILKVGHHGSLTSSSETFLNTIQPSIALISAGKNNLYHLPNPQILERLDMYDISTYNTADNSHTSIRFDDHHYALLKDSQ